MLAASGYCFSFINKVPGETGVSSWKHIGVKGSIVGTGVRGLSKPQLCLPPKSGSLKTSPAKKEETDFSASFMEEARI